MVKELALRANDLGLLASITVNRSIYYESVGDFEMALKETLVAIDLFQQTGNISGTGMTYANLLSFHGKLDNWPEVIRCGQKALYFARQRGVRLSLQVYYLQEMARSWWHMDRQDDAQILLGALQQDGMTPQPMYEERLEELKRLIRPANSQLLEIGVRLKQEAMVAFALDEWSPTVSFGED